MLILSRKAGEKIMIGDSIEVTVSRISGNRVTLGITAPDSVHIVRKEIEPIVNAFRDGGRHSAPLPAPAPADDDVTPILFTAEAI